MLSVVNAVMLGVTFFVILSIIKLSVVPLNGTLMTVGSLPFATKALE